MNLDWDRVIAITMLVMGALNYLVGDSGEGCVWIVGAIIYSRLAVRS